jgi:hypothetical protein
VGHRTLRHASPSVTLGHLPSLALIYHHPLDESTHHTRVYFRHLTNATKTGSHYHSVVSGLHCTRRQINSYITVVSNVAKQVYNGSSEIIELYSEFLKE